MQERSTTGRDVEPLRVPAPLDRLPWDLAQDQFEVQGADFIAIFGRLLLRYAQDQIRIQLPVIVAESRRLDEAEAKDQSPAVAVSRPP